MRNEAIEAGAAGSAVSGRIAAPVLDQLFYKARTHNVFLDREVPEALLDEAVDITLQGPTSVNQLPLRVVFVRSPEAKARLKDALMPGNLDKTMAAPVTAILAYDLKFYEHLPRLFPHADAKAWFEGNDAFAKASAHTNATLQAAYFIMALRSLGLDAGPMTGFDNAKLDAEFFPDGQVKSNILVNIGYGDHAKLFPRSPRFRPEEIATYA
jgi:3-hydroxypropanoate dehydrogenase